MRTDEMTVLTDFNQWVNHRLLDAAAGLTDEQFRNPDAPTNLGLRASLVHQLDNEQWWRLQVSGLATDDLPDLREDDFPDLATLRARWEQDEAEMNAWLPELTDEFLNEIAPPATGGAPMPRWYFLMHRLAHSRQLQADVATMLSALGHSPSDLDFLDFIDERQANSN